MAAAVFTFVLLLGNVLREVLPLIISQKASFGVIARAFGLLIPFVAVFALPMGLLTATLLVFGRFSADQELTAARASGVSLLSLATPVIVVSLFLSGLSAWVNLDVAPRSRVAYNNLRMNLRAALLDVKLPEGRYIELPGEPARTIYVGKNRNHELQDILMYQVRDETNVDLWVTAPRGELVPDPDTRGLKLKLYDAKLVQVENRFLVTTDWELPLSEPQISIRRPGIGDMTFNELREELKRINGQLSLPLNIPADGSKNVQERKRDLKKQMADLTEPIRIQMHQRVAFSFACLGFTLIGIPLGIRMHRRETNVGVAMALLLVAVYYGLLVAAESLSGKPEFAPHLLMWLPNFLFQAVGAVLLWRANRGL